jgi:putative sterol carrier protein
MKAMSIAVAVAGVGILASQASFAAPPLLMSPEWGQLACAAWNQDPVLTQKLHESGWSQNDQGRGYRIMQIYRKDCPNSPRIEMRISEKDGKAMCVYGGKVEKEMNSSDFSMYADTKRWVELGKLEYGPMKAMMFGRLGFTGPMMEAMKNMGPFESFMSGVIGKVDSDTSACPQ